jgi:hypothetical protein
MRENSSLLKLDCEGCEYGLILDANRETLRRFKRIIIEYHNGYENLCNKLREAGFFVRHTVPKRMPSGRKTLMIGLIFAELDRSGEPNCPFC